MEDSLLKRYLIKLVSTILITVLNASVQIVLPNALTVTEYADYTYNLNVFTSVISIAILSADGAFSSKISKRLNESGLIFFYGKFLLVDFLVLNSGFFIGKKTGLLNQFFGNQTIDIILLALNASLLIKLLQEFISLFDCYALTRISEPFIVVQKVVLAIVVYAMHISKILKLKLFYEIQIGIIVIICIILAFVFVKKCKYKFVENKATKYVAEFVDYCRPLVLANIFSNVLVIISNWFLKRYGGNSEQAFYGVAWQLNGLIAYTFTPITVLLQREYAVRAKQIRELGLLYQKVLGETMTLVSFFACFVLVNADFVLETLFGSMYVGATAVTQMIMIYTIFQAWGQVNGAMYLATERTSIYAKISMVIQVCSLVCILLFQIPNSIFPESMGAMGMGMQKTVCNVICVIICGYFNCKYLGFKFYKEYIISLRPIIVFFVVAEIVRIIWNIIRVIFEVDVRVYVVCVISGIIYTIITGILLLVNSNILGVKISGNFLKKFIRR